MRPRIVVLLVAAFLGLSCLDLSCLDLSDLDFSWEAARAETHHPQNRPGARGAELDRMEARVRVPARRPLMIPQRLVTFRNSPFPFEGTIPGADKPFLEPDPEDGRLFHDSPRGGKLYLDTTYSDQRSLIYASPFFDPTQRDAAILLFLHGNLATLQRDVADRQSVPRQLADSGLNAVLVAPQMAVDAKDSTAGHFYDRGFFETYLDEAAAHIAAASGGRATRAEIARLPVIIVAYSGGYLPTAFSLRYDLERRHHRIIGVVLLDALFGEEAKFEDWIMRSHKTTFFVSAYTDSSEARNLELRNALQAKGLDFDSGLPNRIHRGTIAFQSAVDAEHDEFVTEAWVTDPLALILKRIRLGRE